MAVRPLASRQEPAGPRAPLPALLVCRCPEPHRHDGAVAPGAWIGDGRARANSTDIARAMWLYMIAGFLGVALLALLALVAQYF